VEYAEFQHVAGTRAQLDFVETPSTLMEYYAYSPRVLSLFARHWRTGAPIPESDLAALQVRTRTTQHTRKMLTSGTRARRRTRRGSEAWRPSYRCCTR
jgi:Zn-dependent oligopeptidase